MRVYVPSTLTKLAELQASGEMSAPVAACAVTPDLREWYAEGDTEELEYVALTTAARASLRLLLEDGSPPRRVVLAADVPDAHVARDPGGGRADVVLSCSVELRRVAAVHVDDGAAQADVEAAAKALTAADAGEDDAQFVVDGAEAHELAWFATQEIPGLLGPA